MDVFLNRTVLRGVPVCVAGAAALVSWGHAAVVDPMRPPAQVLQARQTGGVPAPAVLQVQAIKVQNGVASALVAGRWHGVGDTIDGGRVVAIDERGVKLKKNQEMLTLTPWPVAVPAPVSGGVAKP